MITEIIMAMYFICKAFYIVGQSQSATVQAATKDKSNL